MNQKTEKFFRSIIEIMDSQQQQQEVSKKQVRRKEHHVSSQIKPKVSHLINAKKEKQWSNRSCTPLQKTSKNIVNFQDIYSFNDIQLTNNLSEHLTNLKKFIEYSQKNVLFIFGPSGCGKTLLTLSTLRGNNIDFQFAEEKIQQNEYGENIYEDSIDILYRIFSLKDKIRQKIYISKDFPISFEQMPTNYSHKYKAFKQNAYDLISNISNRNKYIFLLNSQIYSSYYLLSQASQSKGIHQLKNVSVIKMEPYGPRDLKKIINRFVSCNPEYSTVTNQVKTLDEIVTQANGDARKALNIIYYKKIREIGKLNPQKYVAGQNKIHFYDDFQNNSNGKSSKKGQLGTFSYLNLSNQQAQSQKEQLKVGIFHALGKFLYGKRYNVYYNPNDKKNKKTNNISCFYTQEQIDRLNPKFYFKPVQLLEKSHMNINVCADLLQQNFLNRYGKVKDIVKMYGIFRYFDSYLQDTLNKFEVKEQMQEHLKELLTWGIIVYNKNTIKENTFFSIQRSKNNIFQKIAKKKDELIKIYYLRNKDSMSVVKNRKKDIIQLGYLLRTNNCKIVSTYNIFLQKLIDIIFDNGKRSNSILSGTIEKEVNVIQDEQQEIASENCNKLNKITEILNSELKKKEKLFEMMIEDSDESDIDSD